jgi:hypothetical protein
MLAVAVVGVVASLLIQSERTAKRRSALYQIMRNHAILAGAYRGEPVGCVFSAEQYRVLRAHAKNPNQAMAAYHDALQQKYRDARAHPWRPVPPDPPAPE